MGTKTPDEFFIQRVKINTTTKDMSRIEWFSPYISGKKVLHVGFVDHPITRPKKTLHRRIAPACARIDGIDPNVTPEIIAALSVPNGNIYLDWKDVPNDYDVILVPEVIEHVDNVRDFLEVLDSRKGQLIITAPCAYLWRDLGFEFSSGPGYDFIEYVHPDHNCWYSPYTLKNTIEKYSKTRKVESLHWIGGGLAAVCTKT